MLGKLFKRDFRALSRTMIYFVLGIIVLSLLMAVVIVIELRQLNTISYSSELQSHQAIFQMMLVSAMLLFVFGISACITVIYVFIYIHYYKSFFSDEGYLTHTLPVKSWQLVFSKLSASLLWAFIGYASLIFGLSIIFAGTFNELKNLFALFSYKELFTMINDSLPIGTLILYFFNYVSSLASSLLRVFLAITIGCAISNKNRIWVSIGIYLAVVVSNSILTSIISGVVGFLSTPVSLFGVNPTSSAINLSYATNFALNVGISIACFFWINHLLKHKLNLQ